MDTTTRATPEAAGADNRADRGAPGPWHEGAAKQTNEPFAETTSDAVYCPVLEARRWNEVMEDLHRRDPVLGRKWRETKDQPGPRRKQGGPFTKVLALPKSGTDAGRWVLYSYEGDRPGSGIESAARYAQRAGLKQLAVDGRDETWLTSDEVRRAIADAVLSHETEIVIHRT